MEEEEEGPNCAFCLDMVHPPVLEMGYNNNALSIAASPKASLILTPKIAAFKNQINATQHLQTQTQTQQSQPSQQGALVVTRSNSGIASSSSSSPSNSPPPALGLQQVPTGN